MTESYIDPINANINKIFLDFREYGYSLVDESQYSPMLASRLRYHLEKPSLLQVEKIANSSQIKLIYPQKDFVLASQIQSISLPHYGDDDASKTSYQERNFWQKFLPIAIFTTIYFMACYILGQGLERLVSIYFLFGVPFLIGALITYAVHYKRPISTKQWFKFLNCSILLCFPIAGSILGEGSICLILASPFLLFGIYLGAFMMDGLCRYFWKPNKAIYAIAALPLLLLVTPEPIKHYYGNTHQSIIINASTAKIWQQLNNANNIEEAEVKDAWMYKIGVPYPISGITQQTSTGLIRYSTWQKGIHFEEIIDIWQPERLIHWDYRFSANSIPKGALDDHVTIGGKHFDLLDTSYRLTPINHQQTKLEITVNYRVSTDMNFYAGFVADTLISNFSSVILNFYKNRSEQS